ncbi:hypothetical protein DE146DRAFT_627672 [Phaeosphaeria sp. MPI-PUGE-AT-0046c]|nr:hypothetical protein DE146DRAFT_627672 [Phaeosphaeria sp. MPI-PUGE-AT-0046c]
MNTMVSHVHDRGSLPPLSTSKDVTRRDSLSSSRTRDSGYNSDLDLSCSPLDYIDCEQHIFLAPLPALPDNLALKSPSLINSLRSRSKVSSFPRSHFTDCQFAVEIGAKQRPLQIKGCNSTTSQPAIEQHTPGQVVEIEKWITDNLPSYNRPDKRVSSIVSLSSATSCEMYTDTDMSEDEHEIHVDVPQPSLTHATMKTIDIVMRKIEVQLCYAAYMQCNGGGSFNTSGSSTTTSQQSSRKASHSSGKRKSQPDDTTPPNDDQDSGSHKRRRGSQATISSSESATRFACPFYKHEPHRFRSRRTCPGPGWTTVHRMKEHLYRAHCQLIYCPRCYATFDVENELSNHLRSAQCSVSAPQPMEGIDRETLKTLRKRSPAFRLEEDKWRDVYHLLFPEVGLEDIPSPFYDSDSPSESSRRFRRELLRLIQTELVNTAQRLPGPVEQQLLHQVAGIIRRCENDLLTSLDSSSNLSIPAWSASGNVRRESDVSSTPSNGTPMPGYNSRPAVADPLPVDDPTIWLSPEGQIPAFRPVPWGLGGGQDAISSWPNWENIFPAPGETCGEGLGEYGVAMPMWREEV